MTKTHEETMGGFAEASTPFSYAAAAVDNPLRPVHPGEILREEFLEPLGLSSGALAKALHVPRTRIERLVREETPITPDTALRLSRYFGNTAEFWLGIQAHYDLESMRDALRAELAEITPRPAA